MTTARNHHLFLNESTYYHLMNRCVRRAFLCGIDKYTKKCYDHRKKWMEDRVLELAEIFFIDLYGYAVMSNHYHLIVQTRPDEMRDTSNADIARRWCRLFPRDGENIEQRINNLCEKPATIDEYRNRLTDISWLMRCINQHIACKANKEDKVNGRFWQGRFKSQLLLDEPAVLACMAYVDLNPIRAKIATSLEESSFTSIANRLLNHSLSEPIKPISSYSNLDINAPDVELSQYIGFVAELAEKHIRKSNIHSSTLEHMMDKFNLKKQSLDYLLNGLTRSFSRAIGSSQHFTKITHALDQRWIKGIRKAKALFG